MVKKKYHGGLKVLLSLLFGMLFAMSSTCYALTPVSDFNEDDLRSFLTLCKSYNTSYSSDWDRILNNTTKFNNLLNSIKTNLNQLNITYLDQLSFISDSNTFRLFGNNNTIGNSLNHILTVQESNNLRFFGIDDSENKVTQKYLSYTLSTNTNGFVLNINTSTVEYGIGVATNGYKNSIFNVSNSSVNLFNAGNFRNKGTFKFNDNWFWTTLDNVVNYIEPVPDIPSGDTSGDSSGDTPIEPSGDGGGNIDYTNQLNNINESINDVKNQISGDTQKVIDNQNENIDKITGTITNTDTNVDPENEFDVMLSSTSNVVDPTTNFFSWLIDNLRTILNSTGNYNIQVTLFDKTYIIRSDFFVLPDGDLKTFLQLSFVGWFGWHIIKKIRYIVYAIQCVNIQEALHQCDFNPDIL